MRNFSLVFAFCILTKLVYSQITSPYQVSNSIYQPSQIDYKDLNGDGLSDIVTSSLNGIYWCEQTSMGIFSKPSEINFFPLQNGKIMCISDFDNDGDQDILSKIYNEEIQEELMIYWNEGNMIFTLQSTYLFGNDNIRYIEEIDLNGDEFLDLTVSSSMAIHCLINDNGNGFIQSDIIELSSIYNSNKFYYDWDNDGWLDVFESINGYEELHVYRNNGDGTLADGVLITNANGGTIDDLNNDGLADLIQYIMVDQSTMQIHIYAGNAFQQFSNVPVILSVFYYVHISISDFNMDNIKDIFISDLYSHTTDIIELDAAFNTIDTISNPSYDFSQLLEADIDPDVSKEYIYCSQIQNMVGWLDFDPQNSMITYRLDESISQGVENYEVDIDNDSFLDILICSPTNREVALYKNNNGQGFSNKIIIFQDSMNSNNPGLNLDDADNDGDIDIFYKRYEDGTILLRNEITSFTVSDTIIASGYPYSFKDINNDGISDFITSSAGNLFIQIGNGNGTFQSALPFLVSLGQPVAYVDFDNDGDLDIITNDWNQYRWLESVNPAALLFEMTYESFVINDNLIINVGEFNDDEYTDIRIGNTIFLHTSGQPESFMVSDLEFSFPAADFNDDNLLDYIGFADPNYVMMINNGDNTFQYSGIMNDIYNFKGNADFDNNGTKEELYIGENILIKDLEGIQIPTYLSGHVFYDTNQNGLKELDEPSLNLQVHLSNGINESIFGNGVFSYTGLAGDYLITVSYDESTWALTSDSASFFVSISNFEQWPTYPLDFGFYPVSETSSILANLNTWDFDCTLTQFSANAYITNNGSMVENGIVSIQYDQNICQYINAYPLPDSISNSIIYWSFTNLLPSGFLNFYADFQYPQLDFIGDSVLIELDVITANSTANSVFNNIVSCAYDPNDKHGQPEGFSSNHYIAENTEMEYIIRFQNTGNMSATNVMVHDQLSSFFDYSSIEIVGQSHPMSYSLSPSGDLNFFFNNIYLPDSSSDLLGSQGYVKFRINLLPTAVAGTVVLNFAEIFFDINPAIITNTVSHTIYNCEWLYDEFVLNETNGVLSATLDAIIYQWYFGDSPIENANSYSYTPNIAGHYYVIAELSGDCIVQSETFTVLQLVENIGKQSEILVYPNPFTDFIELAFFDNGVKKEISITDLSGKSCLQLISNSGKTTIDTSSLANGIYLIRIKSTNGFQSVAKMIKI